MIAANVFVFFVSCGSPVCSVYDRRKSLCSQAMKIFLRAMLIAAALALSAAEPAQTKRPNIVWIVGEDMGPELGCYGDRNAITPNIDRLARE